MIGSGVSGLTSALALSSRGARVTVYADPAARPRASDAAPALFTPYPGSDPSRFRRWTERSFDRFTRLARESGPESGVRLGRLRRYFASPPPIEPWLDALLGARPIRPVPPPFAHADEIACPHVDMRRYLPWLVARARAAGVGFVDRLVATFDDLFALGHRVIVNAAGLGARPLARDPLLRPMHGQVLHVPNDIGLSYSLHDDAHPLVAYIFRFGDRLVLGGTFEGGREDATADRPSLDAIVERCRTLLRLDGHPRWAELARRELGDAAGARPARGMGDIFEDARVERTDLPGGRAIVHNYGHGRSGVTFSWACAKDAADLAMRA